MKNILERRRERGVVLVVILVVLVAMTLSSLSLLRSIDTAQLLSGNIGFKRDAINRAAVGLQAVVKTMTRSDFYDNYANYCSTGCTNNPLNYVPRMMETDVYGIPMMLQTGKTSSYDGMYQKIVNASVESRYLIERMCLDYNEATIKNCVMDASSAVGGTTDKEKAGIAGNGTLYRVTVRADGPRNSLAFAQAIVTLN